MSQNIVPPRSDPQSELGSDLSSDPRSSQRSSPQSKKSVEIYSAAGKVFLLGEYAVLAGLPALVGTLSPRFKLSVETAPGVDGDTIGPNKIGPNTIGIDTIHPDSPLGRLQSWAKGLGLPELKFQWDDPFRGKGGFGASTAQFAMGYMAYSKRADFEGGGHWKRVWTLYRELMGKGASLPPSGADLISQWLGGVILFDPSDGYCRDLWPVMDWSHLLVFSATSQAGRKVATHEHLAALTGRGFPNSEAALISKLKEALLMGFSAVQNQDLVQFGKAMDTYAEVLHRADLEAPATYEDRQVLRRLSGVLGVKGTGALQSDGILVLMQPHESRKGQGTREDSTRARQEVIEMAQSRGLELVSEGLTCQMGVTCLRSE